MPIPKKDDVNDGAKYSGTALISYASEEILKMSQEKAFIVYGVRNALTVAVQAAFRKGRGSKEFQRETGFGLLDHNTSLDCLNQEKP